jgi:hypothetical protein
MKRLWFALLMAMALGTSSLAAVPVAGCAGTDGCTPGYWKQPQHLDSWTAYVSDDLFDVVFGVDSEVRSLGEALHLKGGKGGFNQLARHAVAALLNAASPDVDYGFTEVEIIALVQDAFASGDAETAKDMLATENELGCPLD